MAAIPRIAKDHGMLEIRPIPQAKILAELSTYPTIPSYQTAFSIPEHPADP